MGLIFKRDHIEQILQGVKTQTRRIHKRPLKAGRIYDIKKDWYHSTGIKIRIVRVYAQRLGDITTDGARKEGGYTIDEFKGVWKRILGPWNPEEKVIVYEFKLVDSNNT